jgi:thiol-disulfide isomerase/thioredoxin
MNGNYEENQPARGEIDALAAPLVIEFGTAWCGHCMAAQPLIASVLQRLSGAAPPQGRGRAGTSVGPFVSRQVVADTDLHGARPVKWRAWSGRETPGKSALRCGRSPVREHAPRRMTSESMQESRQALPAARGGGQESAAALSVPATSSPPPNRRRCRRR